MDVLKQEISRDRWIGAVAAMEIAAGKPIGEIEYEALDALESVIRVELQEREQAVAEYAADLPF